MENDFIIKAGVLIKFNGNDKEVSIPSEVNRIGDDAFKRCTRLEKVTFSNNIIQIGENAFFRCTNLKMIVIPQSVKQIGIGAFLGCSSLEKVVIKGQLTKLRKSVFYNCSTLKEVVLPDSMTLMEERAFMGCTSLTTIYFGQALELIATSAFENCSSLEEIQLPKRLQEIGNRVFYHCCRLKKVIFNQQLTNVGISALQTDSQLTVMANEKVLITPTMFDDQWYMRTNRKENKYQLVFSYLPRINLDSWKDEVRSVLAINFLETYSLHHYHEAYLHDCYKYKLMILNQIIKEKRYLALNQGIELKIFSPEDIEPYFDLITDREQRAKLLASRQINHETDDLANQLDSLF